MNKQSLLASIQLAKQQQSKELYLYQNELRYLPSEIGQLIALKELVIGNNQLRWLPCEIAQLKNLRGLYANDNQLNKFPSAVLKLPALQSISLFNNPIGELPAEIEQLTQLRELYLHNTQLHQLPELEHLHDLAVLDVSRNYISYLSPKLAVLKNLRVLDVRHNPCVLPEHIGELKKQGEGVYIPQNCYLPDEMLNESSGMIDRYLTGW